MSPVDDLLNPHQKMSLKSISTSGCSSAFPVPLVELYVPNLTKAAVAAGESSTYCTPTENNLSYSDACGPKLIQDLVGLRG